MIPIRKALEMLATLAETAKQAELKQGIAELQSTLISAFDSYQDLLEKNISLIHENQAIKDEVKKNRDWETEKQNYERKKFQHSYFYYRKETPDDWTDMYCPHCFELREKVIHLQISTKDPLRQVFCPACKNEYRVV